MAVAVTVAEAEPDADTVDVNVALGDAESVVVGDIVKLPLAEAVLDADVVIVADADVDVVPVAVADDEDVTVGLDDGLASTCKEKSLQPTNNAPSSPITIEDSTDAGS